MSDDKKVINRNYSNHYAGNEWNKLLDSVSKKSVIDEGDGGDEGGGGFTHWRYEGEEAGSEQSKLADVEFTPEGSDATTTTSQDSKQNKANKTESSWKNKSTDGGKGKSYSQRGGHSAAVFAQANVQQANVAASQGSGHGVVQNAGHNHQGKTKLGPVGRLSLLGNNVSKQQATKQAAKSASESKASARTPTMGMGSR